MNSNKSSMKYWKTCAKLLRFLHKKIEYMMQCKSCDAISVAWIYLAYWSLIYKWMFFNVLCCLMSLGIVYQIRGPLCFIFFEAVLVLLGWTWGLFLLFLTGCVFQWILPTFDTMHNIDERSSGKEFWCRKFNVATRTHFRCKRW